MYLIVLLAEGHDLLIGSGVTSIRNDTLDILQLTILVPHLA
jgi:hypothetical protein